MASASNVESGRITVMLGAYARAIGLRQALPSNPQISGYIVEDYNSIIESIKDQIPVDLARQLTISADQLTRSSHAGARAWCDTNVLSSKVSQLVSYLEHIHHTNSRIVEIGTLFNSIKDQTLKERCSDLLSAPGNFDRAINQATQVLENKIKAKSGSDSNLTGPTLVNAVINTNPDRGLIRVSESNEEHEGIGHICRGIMLAFRNPTHHSLSDAYSREDALKVCAFIDNLISVIDRAKLIDK